MTSTSLSSHTPFQRDRLTWLAYSMFGFFAYLIIALGPIMPFLRSELTINYTVGGLHLTVLAIGNVLVGMFGDVVIQRIGRHATFWLGGASMLVAALCFSLGTHVFITLLSAFCMGLFGSFVPIVSQAMMVDSHTTNQAIVLSEMNIVVMMYGSTLPLIIGMAECTGVGWRIAIYIAIVLWVIPAYIFRTERIPEPHIASSVQHTHAATAQPLPSASHLPLLFWGYWSILFLGVAIEWCISLWGTSFFIHHVAMLPSSASTVMTLFFWAMIIGRTLNRYAIVHIPITRLLVITELVALGGFLLFWLAPYALLTIVGLFVAGLGIAGIFPLAVSAGMMIVPQTLTTIASARTSMAAALAMLLFPFILGWLADAIGLFWAFGSVILLIILIMTITFVAQSFTTS